MRDDATGLPDGFLGAVDDRIGRVARVADDDAHLSVDGDGTANKGHNGHEQGKDSHSDVAREPRIAVCCG